MFIFGLRIFLYRKATILRTAKFFAVRRIVAFVAFVAFVGVVGVFGTKSWVEG